MPVTFEPSDFHESGHTVCFPAISQKEVPEDDPAFLKEFYDKYQAVNYYKQHAASASSRGKPGCYTIHTLGDDRGIINMFIRLYTGNRALANDNLVLRVKYFKACLEQLISCRTLTTLHFSFPCKSPDDLKDYIQALSDFWSTYKLNNSVDLNIVVHHNEPASRQPIIKKKTTTAEPDTFKLLCDDSQISEQSLFEVDFVRYFIKKIPADVGGTDIGTVLKYFPDASQWNVIRFDPRLNQIAQQIPLDTVIGDTVYPPAGDLFNAFSYMRGEPKIVLLGQDPYHRKGQAHGLSFSVLPGIAIPPSLRNVYKALANDIPGFVPYKHGNLTNWAEQGVLLLNSALTVSEGTPGSHLDIWEPFTNYLISLLSQKYKNLVFMLWGTKAKAKKALIAKEGDHLVLECQHPSPQITNNTFDTDCKHFSQANTWLKNHGKTEIKW